MGLKFSDRQLLNDWNYDINDSGTSTIGFLIRTSRKEKSIGEETCWRCCGNVGVLMQLYSIFLRETAMMEGRMSEANKWWCGDAPLKQRSAVKWQSEGRRVKYEENVGDGHHERQGLLAKSSASDGTCTAFNYAW